MDSLASFQSPLANNGDLITQGPTGSPQAISTGDPGTILVTDPAGGGQPLWTPKTQIRVGRSGGLLVGNPSTGDRGPGTVNVATNFYLNGVVLGSVTGNGTGMVAPNISGWSWLNQSGSTVSNPTLNGRTYAKIVGPLEVANHWHGQQTPIPATPYAIECMVPYFNNYHDAGGFTGCYLTDGTQLYLNVIDNGGAGGLTNGAVFAYWWSSVTATSSAQIGTINPVPSVGTAIWLRIDDDGVNVNFKYSADGLLWKQYATTTRAAHSLTPTNMGIGIDPNDASNNYTGMFYHLYSGTGI